MISDDHTDQIFRNLEDQEHGAGDTGEKADKLQTGSSGDQMD